MKKILIVNKEKPRQAIIEDIAMEAKSIGYNRDNILKRCLMGILDFKEDKFYGMLRKIVKQELPSIDEIMVMKTVMVVNKEREREEIIFDAVLPCLHFILNMIL